MRSSIELLAPAGSPDAGYAALEYGADAVYLGLSDFSARATADNFTVDQLRPFVGYAKSLDRKRKVYVTINTLVRNSEVPALLESLTVLTEVGVDAVIVQDFGVLRIIREFFPELSLHASTQMAIHDRAGAQFVTRLGVDRIILARELTIKEIADVATIPDLEVEVFVHGALCYAYSGLCLLSSHLRGSSGNRGRCSYLCRERFDCGHGKVTHPMSMKDLAVPLSLTALEGAGVASVKIEGRKKSPLYVAAVTNYYRQLLDGALSEKERVELASDVNTIFAREQTTLFFDGTSKGNLTTQSTKSHHGSIVGRVDAFIPGTRDRGRIRFTLESRTLEKRDGLQLIGDDSHLVYGFCAENFWHVGGQGRGLLTAEPGETIEVELPDGHARIPVGATISCISSMRVKRSYTWPTPRPEPLMQRIPVAIDLETTARSVIATLRFTIHERDVEVSETIRPDESFAVARKDPMALAAAAFSKLGGTLFYLGEIQAANPDGLFVPMSLLNHLRRALVDAAMDRLKQIRKERAVSICPTIGSIPQLEEERWGVKVDCISYLSELTTTDLQGVDEVTVACSERSLSKDFFQIVRDLGMTERLRMALPPIVRAKELHGLVELVKRCLDQGVLKWEVSNPLGMTVLEGFASELDVRADWPLYVMNEFAVDELMSWNLTGVTASPEEMRVNLVELVKRCPNLCVPVYQDTPLAISEACIHAGRDSCADCGERRRHRELNMHSDRDDLLAITRECRTVIVNERPYSLVPRLDELRQMGVRRFRADFVWKTYSPNTVAEIFRGVRSGDFQGGHVGDFDEA